MRIKSDKMDIYYYGTDLDSAGHCLYRCNNNIFTKPAFRYAELMQIGFCPESFGDQGRKKLNLGDVRYGRAGKYTICYIEGGCVDQRGGTKTVFFTDQKIYFGEFVLEIMKVPICRKIIKQCRFKINWGLNEDLMEKLKLID